MYEESLGQQAIHNIRYPILIFTFPGKNQGPNKMFLNFPDEIQGNKYPRGESRMVAKFLSESYTFHIKSKTSKMLSCKFFSTPLDPPLHLLSPTYSDWRCMADTRRFSHRSLSTDICSRISLSSRPTTIFSLMSWLPNSKTLATLA